MYNKYFIKFNDMKNTDLNIHIVSRIAKPIPTKRYEEKTLPGKDGSIYIDKGYEDVAVTLDFNFASRQHNSFEKEMRNIKSWLFRKINNQLIFSDDFEVHYRVKKVVIDTPERLIKRVGKFKVTFTCDPYTYLNEGIEKINLDEYLYNLNMESKPIYIIKGEGLLNFNVNGKNIVFQVGQNLTIDTELKLCYREDGEYMNSTMTGKYDDMHLKEGENIFQFPSSFKIEIIPNWRII